MIIDLKHYLATAKTASLLELAQRFNRDALVMRDMLSHLICKGLVRKTTKTPACGSSCSKCNLFSVEFYEWVAE